MKEKIGVLIPQSNAHPLIGKSFINGLRLALADLEVDYCVESIGLGEDPKQQINAFQKLSYQENVTLTTGIVGHNQFSELANFVSNNNEVLLASDLGSNASVDLPKGVFKNSLELRQSLKSLVHHLANKKPLDIATSTCYYEAGYGFISALEEAIHETENTAFAGHYITPLHPRENESTIMRETFESCNPDVIVGFHNGVFAQEHASYLSEQPSVMDKPMYCLPFSFLTETATEYPHIASNIKLVSSWFPELDNDANKVFVEKQLKNYQKTPDFFALMGYENGLVIANALTQKEGTIADRISNTNIKGPRGIIRFQNQETSFENHCWNQNLNHENKVVRSKFLTLPSAPKIYQAIENQGWFNAYLCH